MPVHYDGSNFIFAPIKDSEVEDTIGTYIYELLLYYDKNDRPDLVSVFENKLTYIIEKPYYKRVMVHSTENFLNLCEITKELFYYEECGDAYNFVKI